MAKKLFVGSIALVGSVSFAYAGHPNGTKTGNLSGYAQAESSYSSVSANWIVPTVTFGIRTSFSSNLQWIGINGLFREVGGVVQGGTGQDVAADTGAVSYYGWYANANGGVQKIPAKRYPVQPGDTMSADLTCTADCMPFGRATWVLVLRDLRQQWTFSQTLKISSGMGSAEVIEEDTSDGNGHTFPWPNYGSIVFTDVTINGAAPNFTSSQALYSSNVTATSLPSDPNASANGFSVCWGPPLKYSTCPKATTPEGVAPTSK